jgi:hypothetical protein
MDKKTLDYIIEKTHELINAPSCSPEAKKAAQDWLDAVGSEKEASQTQKYIDELEEDIVLIDDLISFAESDHGTQVFGADVAKNIAAHAKEIKSAGAKYCDCLACAAAAAIVEKKDNMISII